MAGPRPSPPTVALRALRISGLQSRVGHLGGLDFLVGSQFPAVAYEVDLDALRVRSEYTLNGEADESVYGVCLLPDEFDDPPPSLFWPL